MAKIISISNQKGGVGKTTTSINLSACLAVAEKRTLLIDLDPQGNSSVGLGLRKEKFHSNNIYHAMIGGAPIEKAIYKTDLPFLDVCPSDNHLVGAEIELVGAIAREFRLKNTLEPVLKKYDYIIIDCAPSLGLLTVNALAASDSYVVPMQTEFFAMEGLMQLQNTVKLIKGASINRDLKLEGILLTMFDARNNLHKQVAQEIKSYFKPEDVFETIIPRNVKLSECPSFGKPVILYDIESKGSEAYFSLAKEILVKDAKDSGIKDDKAMPMQAVAPKNNEISPTI